MTETRPLKPYQRRALLFLRNHNLKGLLLMEAGTGKTIVAIRSAVEPVLVICRRDDFLTWRLELEREGKWAFAISSAKDIPAKLTGSWTLVTYDLLKNKAVAGFIKAVAWQMVIADECHQIKRWSSKRTKAVYRTTRHIPRRIGMTGTAITNHVLDIYSQALFIDDGRTFGSDEWSFKKRYYVNDPTGFGWYPRKGSKDEIATKLKNLAFAIKADDVLDLPPAASVVKSTAMSEAQQAAYASVLDEWQYEIENLPGAIEIDHVIVQLSKLRQISSGFIYYHDNYQCQTCEWQGQLLDKGRCPNCNLILDKLPTQTKWFNNPGKLALLFDLLKDPDALAEKKKVVVWCAHTAEIDRITVDYNHSKERGGALAFTGSLATKARERVRQRFRDDSKVRLFVGQVDAGVGMNELVVADTAIYYSNSFKVASRLQSAARTRRIGSERHQRITYYDLVSENSVDVKLIRGLSSAISIAEDIMMKLRKGMKVREALDLGGVT